MTDSFTSSLRLKRQTTPTVLTTTTDSIRLLQLNKAGALCDIYVSIISYAWVGFKRLSVHVIHEYSCEFNDSILVHIFWEAAIDDEEKVGFC